MASIGEVRNRLNKDFINDLYSIFSPGIADKILQGIGHNRSTTIRVNIIKNNILSIMNEFKKINFKFDRVAWYNDALVLKNVKEKEIEGIELYKGGHIYVQSLSSMIPPLVLQPRGGDRVLDMTAAPGSKTTQMMAIMGNNGYILANDIDRIRLERLKYNLMLQGSEIVEVHNGDGVKIGSSLPGHFDKVLLDAPCSGEGRFSLSNPSTYRKWSQNEVDRLQRLQKKLFESGFKALKKGGDMVYSTCTLNLKENEEIINWAEDQFDFEILDCNLNIEGRIPAFNLGLKNLVKAFRILPGKHMEGFFVCRLRKR